VGVLAENVFIGQVDAYGQFYVDLYDDKVTVPAPQKKASLYATLKKCESDLTLFGLTTNNKQAKSMYEQCAKQMEDVIEALKPVLHH
jgi:hypothetical protein